MRNDSAEVHQKTFNNQIKNLAKIQSQSISKGILSRVRDRGSQKTEINIDVKEKNTRNQSKDVKPHPNITKNSEFAKELALKLHDTSKITLRREQNQKKIKDETASICNRTDVRDSIHKAKLKFISDDFPQLKESNILEFKKLLLNKTNNDTKNCSNDDSRITGGGIQQVLKINKCNKIRSNIEVSKQNTDEVKKIVKETNSTPKVSFKTKNTSRKPVYTNKITTSINSTKVSVLTQKFNEIIKENKVKDNKTTLVLGCKNNVNVKLCKNNTVIITKKGIHKRSFSINAVDKINVCSSPIVKRKLSRVKSDLAVKKKTVSKKRSNRLIDSPNNSMCKQIDELSNYSTDSKSSIKTRPSYKTSNRHSVRATILKFETEKCDSKITEKTNIKTMNSNTDKPKVPEKVNIHKTKNVVIKDGKPKIKIIKNNVENKIDELSDANVSENIKSEPVVNEKNVDHIENSTPKELNSDENVPEIVLDVEKSNNECLIENKTELKDEKNGEDGTIIIQPNESFLWRTTKNYTQYTNVTPMKLTQEIKNDCIDSQTNPTNERISEIYPSFAALIEKTDRLLEMKKKEIADELKKKKLELETSQEQTPLIEAINSQIKPLRDDILEAINSLAVTNITNIRNELTLTNQDDEDYESFDNCTNNEDLSKTVTNSSTSITPIPSQSNLKSNCPLPEVPEENIYHCISEPQSENDDNNSVHSYEYCPNKIERTDLEDNNYEYFNPSDIMNVNKINSNTEIPLIRIKNYDECVKGYSVSKSNSITSSIGYEKILTYEEKYKNPPALPQKLRFDSFRSSRCTDEENIYDVIKPSDAVSISYESISESRPGSVISYDQKTNSIYEQRSIVSIDRVNFRRPPSEISSSDRSDDWKDMSDPENKNDTVLTFRTIVKTKGRHSPTSWSEKVRHHWNESSKTGSNFKDMDVNSDHIYESISFGTVDNKTINNNYISDTDSFESDSEFEQRTNVQRLDPNTTYSPLPNVPTSGNTDTMTRIANKVKKLKKTFTRKKSGSETSTTPTPTTEIKQLPPFITNESHHSPNSQNIYQNIAFDNNNRNSNCVSPSTLDIPNKCETVTSEKSPQNSVYKSMFFGSNDKSKSNMNDNIEKNKDNNQNKKNYLSFKFRRMTSVTNSTESKKTNSTFYINSIEDSQNSNKDEKNSSSRPNSTHDIKLELRNKKVKDDNETTTTNGKKHSPLNIIKASVPRMSIRPNAPPPPPPILDDKNINLKHEKRLNHTTSLYTEYDQKSESNGLSKNRNSMLWYAELGLYQASDVSTSSGASSTLSGSGTCSTSAAFSSSSTPIPMMGMFTQEPLYQFYDAAKLESVCRDIEESFGLDSDIYEEIDNDKNYPVKMPQRSLAMALLSSKKSPSRTLWCEVSEVINSQILGSLTDKQRKVQEAKFEIVTSEASYLNSLTVLESHFINHTAFQDEKVISKSDKQILFGNIGPVKKCSQRFIADLENCWQSDILLRGLCKIVKNHAETNFNVYITYCEYQNYLVKTLEKLKKNDDFKEISYQLQSQPECQSLSLDSFLLLPMQRITRLPLLLDAVLKNLDDKDEEYQSYVDTLRLVNNIVNQCNEGARNMERMEEMSIISSQIEFPAHIKEIQLLNEQNNRQNSKSQRWLVRSGELTHLFWRPDDQPKLTFGKKMQKATVHLFLFTDLLVVTKKKNNEDKYTVIDYCDRSLIEMTSGDAMSQFPIKDSSSKYVVLLTMLENCDNKTIEMLLCCKSESDYQRWLEASSKPSSANPDEVIYEDWDCPQVAAIYSYQASQPDELSLQCGDIIYVHRKIEGWYHGERIRDGEIGWFPKNHTTEINSAHVRAKNLKQRYRLLELAGNYLNQQKKKGSQFKNI